MYSLLVLTHPRHQVDHVNRSRMMIGLLEKSRMRAVSTWGMPSLVISQPNMVAVPSATE